MRKSARKHDDVQKRPSHPPMVALALVSPRRGEILTREKGEVQTFGRPAPARMPQEIARWFGLAFRVLTTNRGGARLDISKPRGREDYRFRIGGRRALYRIDGERLIIEVIPIDSSVYK